MIFLIGYNRKTGKIASFRQFAESQRAAAQDARLELELDLNRQDIAHEVVLLEAENETALRRSHQRYFSDLVELLNDAVGKNTNSTL